jgi:hypothetical protein
MSERYKSRTREPAARGPSAGQEQEKTEKLRAMIQILEDKLAKVRLMLLELTFAYFTRTFIEKIIMLSLKDNTYDKSKTPWK